ncbi:hypothetical protein CPC08DRAFT_767736 [Agrocybe pediades]|nr:hypothetical protein CPC08DRAFT_767736 [Agrocybe pediades]
MSVGVPATNLANLNSIAVMASDCLNPVSEEEEICQDVLRLEALRDGDLAATNSTHFIMPPAPGAALPTSTAPSNPPTYPAQTLNSVSSSAKSMAVLIDHASLVSSALTMQWLCKARNAGLGNY